MSAPAELDTAVKRRMLKAIRAQQELAETRARQMRQDPDKHVFAYLFDNAVRFWGDVSYTVTHDREPFNREQAFVIGKVRDAAGGTAKGGV